MTSSPASFLVPGRVGLAQLPHLRSPAVVVATLCTAAMLTDADRAALESIAGSARWKA